MSCRTKVVRRCPDVVLESFPFSNHFSFVSLSSPVSGMLITPTKKKNGGKHKQLDFHALHARLWFSRVGCEITRNGTTTTLLALNSNDFRSWRHHRFQLNKTTYTSSWITFFFGFFFYLERPRLIEKENSGTGKKRLRQTKGNFEMRAGKSPRRKE